MRVLQRSQVLCLKKSAQSNRHFMRIRDLCQLNKFDRQASVRHVAVAICDHTAEHPDNKYMVVQLFTEDWDYMSIFRVQSGVTKWYHLHLFYIHSYLAETTSYLAMLVTSRGANPNAHDVTGRTSFHAAIVTDAPSVFIYGCRIELSSAMRAPTTAQRHSYWQ